MAEGWWAPYSAERPQLLYSLSKSFTSTAAAFAQVEGLLDLDDAVISHFAEQVAVLVASGRTNRQIGRVLGISEKTAEVHLHHVMSKLDVRSRAEVAVWAVMHHRPAGT